MKNYLLPLIAVAFSLFLSSCGDNPVLDVKEVTKSDLTTPLFLAFDNTLGEPNKKIWAFNESEAVKGTITVVNDDLLRVKTEWYFKSWTYSGRNLTLTGDNIKKTYELFEVSVLGYRGISFGTTYVCVPSTNKSIDGVNYEVEWYNRGLTANAFWDALRKSNDEGTIVDIKLNK